MTPTFETSLGICRFLHDGSAMFVWGSCGFLATLVEPQLGRMIARRLTPALHAAAVALVVSTLAMLPIKTASIAGGWHSALDTNTLATVITATSIGTAWLAGGIATLLLLASLALPVAWRMRAVTVTAGLVLISLVLTGHARMHDGLLGYLQQINDAVHVLASGAWVGALAPLAVIVSGWPMHSNDTARRQALARFSLVGRWVVALILLTGAASTWLIVGGWPFDWTRPYQILLCAKILVVIAMMALAGTNHWHFTPRLTQTPHASAIAIRRGAIGEFMLGLTAIALVAVFGMLNPGM